jgi:alpha-ketoglutarate-dependent taurine dioxygenase
MVTSATPAAPEIALDAARLSEAADPRAALRDLAATIVGTLRRPPHFLRLTGLAPTESSDLAATLARLIAVTPPHPPGMDRDRLMKLSFTRVRVDPEKASGAGAVTAYSRTAQPLALHSDSSYLGRPHPLVLFQFVRADAAGGASVMASVHDIMQAADEALIQELIKPQFPFGKGDMPILFGRPDDPHIRYYRSQIDTAVAEGAALSDPARAALDRLDALLDGQVRTHQFHAASGEIVFMHNTRVLHGRRGFAETSPRLMYRIRMHAGCLG